MTTYRDRLIAGHHDAKKQEAKEAKDKEAASTKAAKTQKNT